MSKKKHAEHDSSERWLLTYADLITLLLALFVVLWSFSIMDKKAVEQAMAAEFGGEVSESIAEGSNAVVSAEIAKQLKQQKRAEAILRKLRESKQDSLIDVSYNLGKITFVIKGDVSFESGSDVLTSPVKSALKAVRTYLDSLKDYPIEVDGHTDDIGSFATNLDLSTRRAISTVNFLINEFGIDSKRIVVQGFAYNKPIVPNTSVENRRKNRRIEIAFKTGETSKIIGAE